MKVDYAFKAKVLRENVDLLKKAKQSNMLEYAISTFNENGVILRSLNAEEKGVLRKVDLFIECAENDLIREYFEAFKINDAYKHRQQRLQKRVADMLLSGQCVFGTLNFNDETLNTTTEKERRVIVVRYLKSLGGRYVANIDFGAKKHREHYHFLMVIDRCNKKDWLKYGCAYFERVRNRSIERDKTRLSKYISKLSNHAIKETTRRSALIYSR